MTTSIREPSNYQIRPLASAMQNGEFGLLERLSLDLFKDYSQSATVANFLGPTGDRQALGWQLPVYAPQGSFGHTGFTGTFVLGVPDQGLALVLLTNRQNFDVDENTEYPDVGPLQRAVTKAVAGVSLPN